MFFNIFIDNAGHGHTQAGKVCAPVALWNIISETLDNLGITIVPLHGNFNNYIVFFPAGTKWLGMQHGLAFVHVFNETTHSAGICKVFALAGSLIDQFYLYPVVKER